MSNPCFNLSEHAERVERKNGDLPFQKYAVLNIRSNSVGDDFPCPVGLVEIHTLPQFDSVLVDQCPV